MNIGNAIRELRRKKGLTQLDLALKAGLSQTALSQIEKGKRPGEQTVKRLSKALQVSEAFLYVMSFEKEDVPESKRILYEKLFPVIKAMILELASDEDKPE